MKRPLTLVYVLTLALNVIAEKKVLSVGGLFPEEDEQIYAFNYAIATLNSIPETELELTPILSNEASNHPHETIESICSLLEQGIAGIFSPIHYKDNKLAMHSLCDEKEMPLLDTGWNFYPPRSAAVVNFYPHPPTMSYAYRDIVEALGWKSFTILYENGDGLLRVNQLLKMMDPKNVSPVVLQKLDADNDPNYRKVLRKARTSGQTNFVVDCSLSTLEELLKYSQQTGLITNKYSFFITNPDVQVLDMEPYMYSETNITGIRFLNPSDPAVVELSEKMTTFSNTSHFENGLIKFQTALLIDAIHMFHNGINGLNNIENKELHCDYSDYLDHGYSLVNMIKTSSYSGVSGLIKFDQEGFRTDFAFNIIELTQEGFIQTGTWNSSNGLSMQRPAEPETFVEGESLRNKTFVVITTLTPPYGMLKESENKLTGNEQYEGFGIDLFDEMAQMEGFNYTIIIQDDKKNGVKDEKTGKWSGMLGKVIDGVADFAITDLTITSDRAEAVDFTTPFMTLGISILYQKAKKAPPSFFSFADPFSLEVWVSLAAAYLIVSVSLFMMGRMSPDEWTNPFACIEEPEFLTNQFSLRNSFWFTIGSLMQQGSEIAPIAVSTRMVAGMWWFFTLIMVSSYTANLAAFLTTENADAHFTNVQELVERAEKMGIRYGAKANGATANFFLNSNDSVYRQIGEYMKDHPEVMVNDNKEGVDLANDGYYAFFMESTSIEYEIERKCNLTQVGGQLDEKGYGIAMRKNSPYGTAMNTVILKLQASGVIRDLKRKWWQERHGGGQCTGEAEEESAVPLNLKSVEGVFYVTVGGIVLSVASVIIEMALHTLQESLRNHRSFVECLKDEVKFYAKFGENVKPVNQGEDEESKAGSSPSGSEPKPYGFIVNGSPPQDKNKGDGSN